ncbi:hypothetical protein KAW80_01990 [Candidatus Babeliales bacterium]|nr:hypothetical protein [Candidatus Babeliales bacterium]
MFKKKLSLILLLFSFSQTFLFSDEEGLEDESNLFYNKIEEQNLLAFKKDRKRYSAHTMLEWVRKAREKELNPDPFDKRQNVFQLFKSLEKRNIKFDFDSNITDFSTWKDLNLFCGEEDKTAYVANKIDRTSSEIGRVTFLSMLASPVSNITKLKKRQAVVKELLSNKKLFDCLDEYLKKIKKAEALLISLWDDHPMFKCIVDNQKIPTKILESLNFMEPVVGTQKVLSHGQRVMVNMDEVTTSAILLAVLGKDLKLFEPTKNYLEEKYTQNRGKAIPLNTFIGDFVSKHPFLRNPLIVSSVIYSGLWMPRMFTWMFGEFALDKYLQEKMISVASTVNSVRAMHWQIFSNDILKNNLNLFSRATDFLYGHPSRSKKIKQFVNLLKTKTFEGEPSIVSRIDRVVVAYRLLFEIKEELEELLAAAGEIDAYMSVARLYKEFENKGVTYSFAEYKESTVPSIEMNGFWHPFIDPNKVVTNEMFLGANVDRSNAIVTGPNAGGKSTILKSMAVGLIMAQSFGIAPASKIVITPFNNIATYFNITDDTYGGNSLYRAEVLRAQNVLEKNKNLKEGEFSFFAMDEMFNGTSPVEGEAAAYSIAKNMAGFNNSICLVATHFPLLTKLEQETSSFNNYKVSVNVLDNVIQYPYKLEKGISKQHIAIDILRNEGFDGEIVDTAEQLVKNIKDFGAIS